MTTSFSAERMQEHRYTRLQEYVESLNNNDLFQHWMALDGETTPTFQGIPLSDWEVMVRTEMNVRGILVPHALSIWQHPGEVLAAWRRGVKKELRKKRHKHALKKIERLRSA